MYVSHLCTVWCTHGCASLKSFRCLRCIPLPPFCPHPATWTWCLRFQTLCTVIITYTVLTKDSDIFVLSRLISVPASRTPCPGNAITEGSFCDQGYFPSEGQLLRRCLKQTATATEAIQEHVQRSACKSQEVSILVLSPVKLAMLTISLARNCRWRLPRYIYTGACTRMPVVSLCYLFRTDR